MPPFADGRFRASTTDLHQLRVAEAGADVDDSVVEVRDAFGDRRLKTERRSAHHWGEEGGGGRRGQVHAELHCQKQCLELRH